MQCHIFSQYHSLCKKLWFCFGGFSRCFDCSIPRASSVVVITPEKLYEGFVCAHKQILDCATLGSHRDKITGPVFCIYLWKELSTVTHYRRLFVETNLQRFLHFPQHFLCVQHPTSKNLLWNSTDRYSLCYD
jgi:hypothetical protein